MTSFTHYHDEFLGGFLFGSPISTTTFVPRLLSCYRLNPTTVFEFEDLVYNGIRCEGCSMTGVVNINSDGGSVGIGATPLDVATSAFTPLSPA